MLCEIIEPPLRVTCSGHLILLDLIALIIFLGGYKLRSSHYADFSSFPLFPLSQSSFHMID